MESYLNCRLIHIYPKAIEAEIVAVQQGWPRGKTEAYFLIVSHDKKEKMNLEIVWEVISRQTEVGSLDYNWEGLAEEPWLVTARRRRIQASGGRALGPRNTEYCGLVWPFSFLAPITLCSSATLPENSVPLPSPLQRGVTPKSYVMRFQTEGMGKSKENPYVSP